MLYISDEWAPYQELSRSQIYEHKTLYYKYNFVNPGTGVHTQNVGSYNNKYKLKINEMRGFTTVQRKKFYWSLCIKKDI